MENKYDELFKIIKNREGFEKSQEIVESIEYLFDIKRFDKAIPFIDYQQNLIKEYHFNLMMSHEKINILKLFIYFSSAINLYFIGNLIWRTIK